ncbi:MAG: hypothetical protein E7502_03880 [Ruminococcus sp.]|nr:hypothetical protein [Ruminococcus sp.]
MKRTGDMMEIETLEEARHFYLYDWNYYIRNNRGSVPNGLVNSYHKFKNPELEKQWTLEEYQKWLSKVTAGDKDGIRALGNALDFLKDHCPLLPTIEKLELAMEQLEEEYAEKLMEVLVKLMKRLPYYHNKQDKAAARHRIAAVGDALMERYVFEDTFVRSYYLKERHWLFPELKKAENKAE